jgi:hypothetical protein
LQGAGTVRYPVFCGRLDFGERLIESIWNEQGIITEPLLAARLV